MDEFVKIDNHTWVRPEAVQMIRMGLDNETLILVGSCETGISVDRSITDTLAVLSRGDDRA